MSLRLFFRYEKHPRPQLPLRLLFSFRKKKTRPQLPLRLFFLFRKKSETSIATETFFCLGKYPRTQFPLRLFFLFLFRKKKKNPIPQLPLRHFLFRKISKASVVAGAFPSSKKKSEASVPTEAIIVSKKIGVLYCH